MTAQSARASKQIMNSTNTCFEKSLEESKKVLKSFVISIPYFQSLNHTSLVSLVCSIIMLTA